MARPLKYGEKTSVRSITMPDTMWDKLAHPKSQWVVEAVRQMLEVDHEGMAQKDRRRGPSDRRARTDDGPEALVALDAEAL